MRNKMKVKYGRKYVRNEYGGFSEVVDNQIKNFHINSQEDYNLVKKEMKKKTFYVNEKISKHLSRIQSRICKINIKNIDKTIDYYFNRKNNRVNAYQDRIFVQSFNQIHELMRNMKLLNETNRNDIKENLNIVKDVLLKQRKFIFDIQEKIKNFKEKKMNLVPREKIQNQLYN